MSSGHYDHDVAVVRACKVCTMSPQCRWNDCGGQMPREMISAVLRHDPACDRYVQLLDELR